MSYSLTEKLGNKLPKQTLEFYGLILERLLNTRCNLNVDVDNTHEKLSSFVSYGIKDFSDLSIHDPNTKYILAHHIEQQILKHELWVDTVQVLPISKSNSNMPIIDFELHITAKSNQKISTSNITIKTTYSNKNFSFYNTNCIDSYI